MSERIVLDLDDTPDATVEVTTGGMHNASVWIKLREGHAGLGYDVWLNPAQALSAYQGLGAVLMAMNVATIEAAGLDAEPFVRTEAMIPPAWDAVAAARAETEPMVIS